MEYGHIPTTPEADAGVVGDEYQIASGGLRARLRALQPADVATLPPGLRLAATPRPAEAASAVHGFQAAL